MKIGVLVGKDADGNYYVKDEKGWVNVTVSIDALDEAQREVTDAGGVVKVGKKAVNLVRTWLDNVAAKPLKSKKCVGDAVAEEADAGEE